jgi:hypothetical protein
MRVVTHEQLSDIGPFSWPGGYANGFIGSDGVTLCYDCAVKALGGEDTSFDAYCSANYEPETCEDCGKEIN